MKSKWPAAVLLIFVMGIVLVQSVPAPPIGYFGDDFQETVPQFNARWSLNPPNVTNYSMNKVSSVLNFTAGNVISNSMFFQGILQVNAKLFNTGDFVGFKSGSNSIGFQSSGGQIGFIVSNSSGSMTPIIIGGTDLNFHTFQLNWFYNNTSFGAVQYVQPSIDGASFSIWKVYSNAVDIPTVDMPIVFSAAGLDMLSVDWVAFSAQSGIFTSPVSTVVTTTQTSTTATTTTASRTTFLSNSTTSTTTTGTSLSVTVTTITNTISTNSYVYTATYTTTITGGLTVYNNVYLTTTTTITSTSVSSFLTSTSQTLTSTSFSPTITTVSSTRQTITQTSTTSTDVAATTTSTFVTTSQVQTTLGIAQGVLIAILGIVAGCVAVGVAVMLIVRGNKRLKDMEAINQEQANVIQEQAKVVQDTNGKLQEKTTQLDQYIKNVHQDALNREGGT